MALSSKTASTEGQGAPSAVTVTSTSEPVACGQRGDSSFEQFARISDLNRATKAEHWSQTESSSRRFACFLFSLSVP